MAAAHKMVCHCRKACMSNLPLAKRLLADPPTPPTMGAWKQILAPSLRVAALVGLAAASAGAGSGGGAPEAPVDRAWAAVEALVATPRCRTDADCDVIGVGSRACGGPETYLAWSTQATERAALRRAVARHAALRSKADAAAGVLSPCVVAEKPAVSCRKAVGQDWGVCVAAPVVSGPGGSSTQR
jgi:hypothetical protein